MKCVDIGRNTSGEGDFLDPTGGCSEEYWTMAERLIQPCRVQDDRPMGCKALSVGKIVTVPTEEAPANSVPAAAVIRRDRKSVV